MVTVREATPADEPRLREMVLELHEALRPFDRDLAPGPEIADRYFRHLQEAAAEEDGAFYVAAAAGGELVGYVCILGRVEQQSTDEVPGDYAFLADLYVAAGYRSGGVGQALVERAEEHSRARGARKLELEVLAGNVRALDFYRRLGYRDRIVLLAKWLE